MLVQIARQIWEAKYRFEPAGGLAEHSIEETWARVAAAAASAESRSGRKAWQRRFLDAMAGFAFIPAGRVLAGAGTGRDVTLFNCFVMGEIGDDMGSIFANVREAALTLQQGGGIGHDFSTLRPKGAPVRGVGADASGPVSFMDVWDAMCKTIMSAGSRRGAMMGTLRCDHPDIEAFIEAKADPQRLRNFNLSVLVTDDFLEAVKADAAWPLVFGGEVRRNVSARGLWHKIMRSAYDYAEPGVIFIDRVNALNNLGYCETIRSTNPCGEQPLPPYGACLLGSINLATLIEEPFASGAKLDEARLETLVPTAVRLLDNIIDVSRYPLPAQEKEAKAKRRIGLGVTGLADALILCGKHYGSEEGRDLARRWMEKIAHAAYAASVELAKEKGAFPLFDAGAFLKRPFPASLPPALQDAIGKHGIRNGVLTSIAPTGTISLLAGNVSSGIEPVFDLEYRRRILSPDGTPNYETVEDHAVRAVPGEAAPSAAHGRFRHGAPAFAARARPHAGSAPAICRRVDLEDRELPRSDGVRRLRSALPRCLPAGPQRLHGLPPESGDRGSSVGRRPARRGRIAAGTSAAACRRPARPRSGSIGLHLQAQMAGLGPCHLRDAQRYVRWRPAPPLRDIHKLEKPGALRLDGGAYPHDQRDIPARRRYLLCRRGA